MSKLISNCIFCQKEFSFYPSENRKYCSQTCRISHKKQQAGMATERICNFCSTKFFPKYNIQQTCSNKCGKALSSKNREKIYNFECENCGIECESHRKNRTTYCSLDCYHELIHDIAEQWKKDRNCVFCGQLYRPVYKIQQYCSKACSNSGTKRDRIIVNCNWCEKEFEKHPGDLGKENNFCSINCFELFQRDGFEKIITKECKNCKMEFDLLYIHRKQEFCSKSCSKTGEFNHFYGKEGTRKGIHPWTFGLTKETDSRLAEMGKKISTTTKQQFEDGSRSNKGENNPNWKLPEDRKTPLNESIRQTDFYKKWRFSVFNRDNFTCVLCNDASGFINADHIKKFCDIIFENNIKTIEDALKCEELWYINNGRTLCVPCHKLTDTYGNKGSKYQ